jgi:peptidoglycan/xylan/chitin deacetylase (PgdA/CDA1 family)
MQPAEIGALAQRFEIGGHTRSHLCLTQMPTMLAASEIVSNKHWLEDVLCREVPGFAYVRGCHNRTVRRLVRDAGFRYARTVKNLASAPGPNRFAIPTTVQFFPHSASTYFRNYVSGGPTPQRLRILNALLGERSLVERLSKAAEICLRSGGCFHLWGHSWELDEYELWGELDRFLQRLRALHRDLAPTAPEPAGSCPVRVAAR